MYCYIGGKGSGKSYSCMQNVCLPAFKQGIPIVTNLALNVDLIRKDFIHADVTLIEDMTEQDIINTPAGSILIIDEIQLICGAEITYSKISTELLEFFSKSRHKVDKGRSINIVVITHTLDGIGKPIRALIDSLYKCRKMSVIGSSKRYQIKQFEMSGGSIVNKKPLVVASGKYSKNVYQYYYSNSQNTSDDDIVQIQEKLVKEKTIFNNRLVQFTLVAPFVLILIYYFFLADLFTSLNPNKSIDNNLIVEQSKIKAPISANISNKLLPVSKFLKINELYGFPEIYLNGMIVNNIPYFSLYSEFKKINISSISISKLRKMGFEVKRLTNELYIINDNLVSYKNKFLPKKSKAFEFLAATAKPKTQKP